MQLVLLISTFIHSLLIHQAIEILNNNRPHTESFYKLVVGLDSVKLFIRSNDINDILKIIEKEISENLAWRSFQRSDKITEALKMISDEKIWEKISQITKIKSQDIKEELNLIIKRRDSIVHEADFDVVNRCQYAIDETSAKRSVNFIIKLAHLIDSIILNYTYNKGSVFKSQI